jgi:hypothetical protein
MAQLVTLKRLCYFFSNPVLWKYQAPPSSLAPKARHQKPKGQPGEMGHPQINSKGAKAKNSWNTGKISKLRMGYLYPSVTKGRFGCK